MWANNLAVTPNTTYNGNVGGPGTNPTTPGGDSWFISRATLVATGGRPGNNIDGGAGGGFTLGSGVSGGGGTGGRGGDVSWDASRGDLGGGGGGAAGYTGGWLLGKADAE